MKTTIAIVILAAGKSARLGQPKQLLPFKGKSLICHCVEIARKVVENVVVVTGAERKRIESEIKNSAVEIVYNPEWEEGIASSIRSGLAYVTEKNPDINEVIFMVCDQPFVTADLLHKLIKEKELSTKSIVASCYSEIAGTPVIFDKSIFPELMELTGDMGARKIIIKSKDRMSTVDFPLGNVDMDTADDYKKLLMQKDLL
ncbi:nucleotidyltransferase family protein [Dyadobacter frigoris]|uniref:Nucleotidyltransferase family protein n=1 Tax=Dyadobacter frigoris TaxID=2576211 RepID=A0A4U6CWZ4_9BACT|nr:nucleotidyltransferase family protein [Dyadobacter frigoris]TKT88187.1 nucleotidyltransferase family protein [Dyadobacter frigoris]GLU53807.1 molybdenum cofactor cytidylyltransferase [Dyadobacter frigoris]